MAPKHKAGNSRSDFLNARTSAAWAENIRKEDRALHRLFEKQIELGRIVLPPEADADAGGADAAAMDAGGNASAVDRQMAWLLAAYHGAGRQPAGSPATTTVSAADNADQAAQGQQGCVQGAHEQQQQQQQGEERSAAGQAPGSTHKPSDEEDEEAAAALTAQMRGISRSLWSTVSSGTASGTVSVPSSRTQADYSYDDAAVAAMRSDGELDARHHRRRDAHTRYMEASARDAAMRRGSAAPKAG